MKKFFVLLLVVVFSFASCDFQIPKSVSIKTKADYNFTVAKIDKDFSQYFSFDKIFASVESDTMKPYDYWPGKTGDLQQYLLSIPVGVIPIDFSSYLNQLEITEKAKEMSFVQEIKVPDVEPVVITEKINLSAKFPGVDTVELPETRFPPKDIVFTMTTSEDSFEECVVKKGQITLEFIPDGWVNTKVDWEVNVTGGLNISNDKWKNENGKYIADLAGVPFKNQNSNMNVVVIVSADSANVKRECTISGSCVIEEIESVKTKLPEGTQTDLTETKELVVNKSIQKIKLGDSKVTFNYWNTMPEGNDLTLKCSSDFLGIVEATKTLDAGTSKEAGKSVLFQADNGVGKEVNPVEVEGSPVPGNFGVFDFNAKFEFDTEDGFIIAKNVTPGETYEVGVDVVIDFEWISVNVKIDSAGLGLDQKTIDTGIDMSTLTSGLKNVVGDDEKSDLFDNLTMPKIPMYVYCQIPKIEAFEDAKFDGKITLGYIPKDGDYVATKDLFDGEIPHADLPKLVFEDKTVVSDVSRFDSSSVVEDLTEAVDIKEAGKSIAVKCESVNVVGAVAGADPEEGVEILKTDLDEYKTNKGDEDLNCNIEIRAIAVLPLKFEVGKGGNKDAYFLDLMGFVKGSGSGESGDLFGRSEALSNDTVTSYLDVIKSARICFADSKLPFKCEPADEASKLNSLGVAIDLGISGENDDAEISMNEPDVRIFPLGSDGKFEISGEDLSKMLNTYPLKASVVLAFPKGTFNINRNTRFDTTINIGLTTDGNIPLTALKGGN